MNNKLDTRSIGIIGEDVACEYISRRGFKIVARNYYRKWGELDIVAKIGETFHFFEVKSVTRVYGTANSAGEHDFKPEENVHDFKMRQIRRMIQTYLNDPANIPANISANSSRQMAELPFQFHVLCVYLNMQKKRARVKWLRNIIL